MVKVKQTVQLAKQFQMLDILDELYSQSKENKVFTSLIPVIASRNNILQAIAKLKDTKIGKETGIDKKTIEDLISRDTEEVIKEIHEKLCGKYEPKAIKRICIPKPNGDKRPLGVSTTIDCVIQQSILQILEPICEAKFNKHSYGFRPACSVENAIADCYMRMQRHGYTYAVKFEITDFFDNINHAKLRQQLWSMGIQDKKLLVILNKILKADIIEPSGKKIKYTKGITQGGIISPLLANIVLNEMDWWVVSQWEEYDCHGWKDKPKPQFNSSGTRNYGNEIRKMRKTNLKEMVIVRYADDFIIFCKNRSTANRVKYAVVEWLSKRLKLKVSSDKTTIINLKRKYCDFLGFKFKLHKKSNKWVVVSHISDKKLEILIKELRKQYKAIMRSGTGNKKTKAVSMTNYKIIGWHNFYGIATNCSVDFQKLDYRTSKCRYNSLNKELSKDGKIPKTKIGKRYGKSKQIRFIKSTKQMLIPVAFTGWKGDSNTYSISRNPMSRETNSQIYSPKDREDMGWDKPIDDKDRIEEIVDYWYNKPFHSSIEFTLNKIESLHSQNGKCKITGLTMLDNPENIHGHHIKPKKLGGKDNKKNIILIKEEVHRLIHSIQLETQMGIIRAMTTEERLALVKAESKLNKLRKEAGNEPISITNIMKQLKLKSK